MGNGITGRGNGRRAPISEAQRDSSVWVPEIAGYGSVYRPPEVCAFHSCRARKGGSLIFLEIPTCQPLRASPLAQQHNSITRLEADDHWGSPLRFAGPQMRKGNCSHSSSLAQLSRHNLCSAMQTLEGPHRLWMRAAQSASKALANGWPYVGQDSPCESFC